MQCGIADGNTADKDRLQPGYRSNSTGSADLEFHILKHGHLFLGGEFTGDGPARGLGNKAEALLQLKAVDLVDNAVDIVGQLVAALFDMVVVVLTGGNALH